MSIEYTAYINDVEDHTQLGWRIENAQEDVKRARDQMLVLAASTPEDGFDSEGGIIDKEDRLLTRFNECYEYLEESLIRLSQLESAKYHFDYLDYNLKEGDLDT